MVAIVDDRASKLLKPKLKAATENISIRLYVTAPGDPLTRTFEPPYFLFIFLGYLNLSESADGKMPKTCKKDQEHFPLALRRVCPPSKWLPQEML